MTDPVPGKAEQQTEKPGERVERGELLEAWLTLGLIVIFTARIGWKLFWLAYNVNDLVPAHYVSSLRNPAVGRCLLIAYLILLGVGLRSLQCMLWLRTHPFRAAALGRFLFGIFMVAEPGFVCLVEWPALKVEVVVEKQPSSTLLSPDLYVVTEKAELRAVNWVDYLSFLAERAKDFIGHLALFLGMCVVYRNFKRGRPDYTSDHFLSDVTFGKFGTAYRWD